VNEVVKAAAEILCASKHACLATLDSTHPRLRIVEFQFNQDLTKLWICTNRATRKVQQLCAQDQVSVFVFHEDSLSEVELVGRASVTTADFAQGKWPGDDWYMFFPEGPQSPRFLCIEIAVERIEVVSVGHAIALGEDPGHWYPPAALVQGLNGWALEPPCEDRVRKLRGQGASVGQEATPLAILGTLNPGKMEACQLCFAEWPHLNYDLQGISVPSNVSEQPIGLEETMLGAKNRAKAAKQSVGNARFGIGLESGVVIVDGIHFDVCACSMYDGERHYVGLSSGWALPTKVSQTYMDVGYNKAFSDLGIPPDDTGAGVLGQLSGGVASRPKQMKESIQMALLQMQNSQLYTNA